MAFAAQNSPTYAATLTPTTQPAVPSVAPVVAPAPTTATGAAYTPPIVTIIAAAKANLTPVYDKPDALKPIAILNNKTNFSGRHVFVVLAREGDWYKVELPMRPNGRTGYVKATDVVLYQHDYAIHIIPRTAPANRRLPLACRL